MPEVMAEGLDKSFPPKIGTSVAQSVDFGLAGASLTENADQVEPPEIKKSRWYLLSSSFPHAIGVAGIKFIFNGDEMKIRRCVWGILLLICLSAMVYQTGNQCVRYAMKPVNTLLDVEYVDLLDFPSVVLCNYNAYRKSYIEDNEAEFAILLKHLTNRTSRRHQDIDATFYDGNLKYTNLTELRLNAAHQLDTIV
ncbi:acid-sensing ion channel 1B-like [Strongylocentrotus purpuratus]|uniref:Uncharacterized protein n=1 Tax=Strongylocentrotus purpuratus TaxID=7668 RepID=A0A7M7PK15_STRPU|nr:acid-sensing ion channel 1B-like [Strongylocentrotus purpuratus]